LELVCHPADDIKQDIEELPIVMHS
jgi:hypothetical protein